MIAESGWKSGKSSGRRKARGECGHHRHGSEVEATWGASRDAVIVHGKVTVAVSIGTGRRDVRWIKHICIHKVELGRC